MATYKVLQDIEAEDTLVGPLTLRQCVYAAVAALAGYLYFISIAKHAAFMVIFLFPFVAIGLFFAFPWSKQQPTEIWALAKIRFYFKPRVRIWNQTGTKELVTVTAPRTAKVQRPNALSSTEVHSRLRALADTIDSRGWAVKNVDLGYYTQPSLLNENPDRLTGMASFPEQHIASDVSDSEDMFDVQNNPVAQKFDIMMTQAAGTHRQQLMQQASGQQGTVPAGQAAATAAPGQNNAAAPYWHMQATPGILPAPISNRPANPASPLIDSDEQALAEQLQPQAPQPAPPAVSPAPQAQVQPANDYAQMRSAVPQPVTAPAPQAPQPPVTAPPNPAILELANNNDLNVATIAREAQARQPQAPQNGVDISLR